MTSVLGISLANPAGLLLLALAIPILLLHVLRPRRSRQEVRSVLLWSQVSSPVSSASPWQRLVPSALLILQLAAVALLAVAAARPVHDETTPLAAHTVFIVDASASMGAHEGAGSRIDLAARKAEELFGELPDGGVASVVTATDPARVTLSNSADHDALVSALDAIEPTEGDADFTGAFALARSLETPGVPIGFVLLSDGGLDAVAQRQIPTGTRYEAVGAESTNRAIQGLTVEARGSGLHVVATLAHMGGPPATQTVRIDVDGRTEHTAAVDLSDGGITEVAADLPAGQRVEAFLEGEDGLDLDDHAYATAPPVDDISVAVIGEPDPFLDVLLGALPGVTATPVDTISAAPDADLVVLNQVPVPEGLTTPYWAIAPPSGAPDVAVIGDVELPAVTLVDNRDPLLADIDLSDLAVAASQKIDAPLTTELVGTETTPLLVRGEVGGTPFLYQTFPVDQSNLPVQLGFPVLGDRILRELSGPATVATSLTVGDRLPVDGAGAVEIRRPGGAVVERPPGSGPTVADRAGHWTITTGDDDPVVVAVNPAGPESHIAVADSLTIPEPTRPTGEGPVLTETQTSVLIWVVVPLLVVLAVEAWMSRRRLGVSSRQWHLALAARAVIAALLLASLAGLAVTRTSHRVATVFLLDASDSLGDGGHTAGLEWIEAAAADQPGGSLAGLAVFGGDAQIETMLRSDLAVTRPAVQIDPSRTDLAGALRLASAILPTDARRRVVLVSDGRATEGDLTREAERLAEDGVVVEFHAVGRSGSRDVAVADLQLPSAARQGEQLDLVAVLDATDAGPARVDLLRDGVQIDSRTVDLVPGRNQVAFPTVAEGTGVVRYQVRVRASGDGIAQNDIGFGATRIEGPARVLVIEGRPDGGATLVAALRAAGITVDTTSANEIPPLEELAGMSSIVLVDVDARTLAPEHVDALVAATRDLGRGLVTVGGTQSYGLGGYRGTDLEELLPVESEILDPERKQSVAEVLAIDTSGSMGACHCAEGNNGVINGNSMVQGGVNKTDISRAGAARAIEALSEVDEVGVLAVDTEERWVIDLQQLPAEDVVTSGLRELNPSGVHTDLSRSLRASATALRESDAALKHIILFTDGFTAPDALDGLADEAASLLAEGITVSVVATGEGAAEQLSGIAEAGGGRFYPGRDLQQIPEIIAEEAVLASRDYLQEGLFVPERTSTADPVAALTSVPPVLGYVATTARPLATTHLRVGEEADPLLASWQVGLGRATSWTSDLDRWGQQWASWPGFVDFWAGVIKDTYPTGEDAGAIRASIDGDQLTVEVEGATAFPDGATGSARVVQPDGEVVDIPLTRAEGNRFTGDTEVTGAGTYSLSARVGTDDAVALAGTALATRSYGAEYEPGDIDTDALRRVSEHTGGRGEIEPSQAFDGDGLTAGLRRMSLTGWLLLAAAMCWPLAVALSRLSLRPSSVTDAARRAGSGVARRARATLPARPGEAPPPQRVGSSRSAPADDDRPPPPAPRGSDPSTPPPPPPPASKPDGARSTLDSLLESKRERRGRPEGE